MRLRFTNDYPVSYDEAKDELNFSIEQEIEGLVIVAHVKLFFSDLRAAEIDFEDQFIDCGSSVEILMKVLNALYGESNLLDENMFLGAAKRCVAMQKEIF